MRAVVIYIVSMFLTILNTTDATTNAGFALVVFTQVLWIRQYSFKELQWNNFHTLINDGLDRVHANVLNNAQVSEVFLTEGHPEASTLNGGVVFNKALNFFVVKQVALLRTNIGVSKRLVNFERFSFNPTTIFPIKTFLCNLADVNFGVEVCSKSLVVVTSVAVNNVEVLNFVKVVFSSISREDACYTWVETATQDSSKSSLFKAILICPLPRVFKVRFVLGFVVSGVKV